MTLHMKPQSDLLKALKTSKWLPILEEFEWPCTSREL